MGLFFLVGLSSGHNIFSASCLDRITLKGGESFEGFVQWLLCCSPVVTEESHPPQRFRLAIILVQGGVDSDA